MSFFDFYYFQKSRSQSDDLNKLGEDALYSCLYFRCLTLTLCACAPVTLKICYSVTLAEKSKNLWNCPCYGICVIYIKCSKNLLFLFFCVYCSIPRNVTPHTQVDFKVWSHHTLKADAVLGKATLDLTQALEQHERKCMIDDKKKSL